MEAQPTKKGSTHDEENGSTYSDSHPRKRSTRVKREAQPTKKGSAHDEENGSTDSDSHPRRRSTRVTLTLDSKGDEDCMS